MEAMEVVVLDGMLTDIVDSVGSLRSGPYFLLHPIPLLLHHLLDPHHLPRRRQCFHFHTPRLATSCQTLQPTPTIVEMRNTTVVVVVVAAAVVVVLENPSARNIPTPLTLWKTRGIHRRLEVLLIVSKQPLQQLLQL